MYDKSIGLYSSSSGMVSGKYINKFEDQIAIRYTINSLLGLKVASRSGYKLGFPLESRIKDFLKKYKIKNKADVGLALLLVADIDEKISHNLLDKIRDDISRLRPSNYNLQDYAWLLWGVVEAARNGYKGSKDLARKLFRDVHDNLFDRDSLIPRYSLNPLRRRITSFGGITYFLRSIYEYASYFDDEYALVIFKESLRRILKIQGRFGEWPWLVDVKTGKVLEWYPVYSVHQDSMAMLFLLPGLSLGIKECEDSIRKSYSWILGKNQLGRPMINKEPFLIYRSIKRKVEGGKAGRYIRAVSNILLKCKPKLTNRVEINDECRSYHLGWILFVWSNEDKFDEFTNSEIFL